MAAGINDKFKETFNSANPNVTFVSTPRSAAATTLICDSLAGWPTNTAVDFITYQLDTDGETVVPGSQRDWKGIVSSNTITNLTLIAGGADAGNQVNDIVEMTPTANWANDLVTGILVSHNQDGTLKSGVVTTAKLDDDAVTTAKIDDKAVTADKLDTDTFSYVSASGTGNQSISSGSPGSTVIFNSESEDTLTEYDTSTGKFTAQKAGIYSVSASVRWAAPISTGTVALLAIDLNGTQISTHNDRTIEENGSQNLSAVVKMDANDTITIRVRQDTGSSVNINRDSSYLTIARIA